MKIAIFSDTHDNIPNTLKALEYIKKNGIGILIHCGDIASGQTLDVIAKKFSETNIMCAEIATSFQNFRSPREITSI